MLMVGYEYFLLDSNSPSPHPLSDMRRDFSYEKFVLIESNIGNHFFSLQAKIPRFFGIFVFFLFDGSEVISPRRKWLYFYTRLMMFIMKTFFNCKSFLNQSNGLCRNSWDLCLLEEKNKKINLILAGEKSSKMLLNNDVKSFWFPFWS